jgi:4-methylaminobutanoate oxidase (formaldehyde-forming)
MVEASEPITPGWLAAGRWDVDVNGRRVPAVASLRPLYDPGNERVRG